MVIVVFSFLLIFICILSLFFSPSTLWNAAFEQISSPSWWGDNILSFLFFTLMVSTVTWFINVQLEKWKRLPYEGWKVHIIWKGEEVKQNLFWKEVEHFEKSDFERWKFVKSIISGVGILI